MLDTGEEAYQAVDRGKLPTPPLATDVEEIVGKLTITAITYRRRNICGQIVWAPEAMTTPQIVELLVARYMKGAKEKS